MIKLVAGDTVLVKHPTLTDGNWKKGVIHQINDFYEIELSNSKWLVINKDNIVYDVNIIKVDSNFNMRCANCEHCHKLGNDEPCYGCLSGPGGRYNYWEPCDSLKNKDKLIGNDIKTFSIDEGPFTDKKVNYSYISTSRSKTVNMLERQMHEQLLASPLKIEKLDMESMYPDLKGGYKFNSLKNRIEHCINTERDLAEFRADLKGGYKLDYSDNVDALRYCIDDARALAEFWADFNKKENKNMKQQQKKRDRNIIKVKDIETRKIKEIMFNGPATIIKWDPTWKQFSNDIVGDKTVTVCKSPDKFDKTTGFLLAVLKEVLDNKSYGNILEKIDEFSKPTVEPELHHCSIKDLTEATEALENVYVPGSVVKYKYGKKYYKVLCYRFDESLKEMVYILQTYKGTCFMDINLKDTRKGNVPHSRLIMVRRK